MLRPFVVQLLLLGVILNDQFFQWLKRICFVHVPSGSTTNREMRRFRSLWNGAPNGARVGVGAGARAVARNGNRNGAWVGAGAEVVTDVSSSTSSPLPEFRLPGLKSIVLWDPRDDTSYWSDSGSVLMSKNLHDDSQWTGLGSVVFSHYLDLKWNRKRVMNSSSHRM